MPAGWPLAGMVALLLLPAALNGVPFMFPDSGAYLGVAWAQLWPVDRAGFYALLFKPFAALPVGLALWLPMVVQVAATALVLAATIRKAIPRASAALLLGLTTALLLLTSLPWHAAQVMPDAFTGPLVLLTWLTASRSSMARYTLLLWFAAAALALTHLTHVGLFAAAGAATLLVHWWSGLERRELLRRCGALSLWTVAIIGFHTAANGLAQQRWTPSPGGPVFLFARLHEDGLIQPWLDEHCPRGATPKLCQIRSAIPRDSQQLLWGDNSPFRDTVWRSLLEGGSADWLHNLSTANAGAIRRDPLQFLRTSAWGTWRQFTSFRALDDECPRVCTDPGSSLWGTFQQQRPQFLPVLAATPQLRGELPRDLVRAISTPVTGAAVIGAFVLFAFALRRRDQVAASLLSAIVLALIANAALAGALSDVHDRYQSRVAWLAPFAVALILVRWKKHARRKSIS